MKIDSNNSAFGQPEHSMTADQGEFFFADIVHAHNGILSRPVFIVGKHNDSNDPLDVIVCLCTTKPARSPYDVEVNLKYPTVVRSNKLFVIERSQLQFKISHSITSERISLILELVERAVCKKKTASLQEGSLDSRFTY